MSTVIWYVVMGIALIGMIWCAKNQKRFAHAQLCAGGCLVLVAISAIMALYGYFGNGDLNRLISNSKKFELSKVDQVAKFVSQKFAGSKVVLLVKSDMLKNDPATSGSQINVVEEMKKRLNGVDILETVVIPVTDPTAFTGNETEPPVYAPEEELSGIVFNAKFNECKKLKPDVIINLAGMPFNPDDSKNLVIWKWKKSDPKVILYEANAIGESFIPDDLKNALAAAVLSKNEVKFADGKAFDFAEDTVPDDLKQAFDLRFVIVTAENVEDLVKNNVVSVMQN